MLSCGLQKFNRTFLVTVKPINMLGGTLFNVFFLLNTLLAVIFAVLVGTVSPARIFLHFNLEKHHLYFAFSFLTTAQVFYGLFWNF